MTREAELELEIARLREALKKIANVKPIDFDYDVEEVSDHQWKLAHSALFTPPSTNALQDLITEVERRTIERCAVLCDKEYPYSVFHTDVLAAKNCAEAIRSLK